ncbi:FAD-dependent oxidoreductase [Agromyces sp. SYSU T00194]|uniref:FAD-dependent oxidoreductase n=1 Tax=Agromyces chitinivorans TaxID=3158560 RepID=UPI00339AA3B0
MIARPAEARVGGGSRRRTVESDLTVLGGGLAGVCAAIAAARAGLRVALVNNRPVVGGNASSEVRVWVCGATSHGAQKFARETGIMGELFLENQYRNPEGNPVLWDHVVLDAVRAEPGIDLFLNTDVHDVEATGDDHDRAITAVHARQSGTETELAFVSALYADCTGDGFVGARAGAWFREGREARSVFGEEWAPDVADSDMLGSTILFYTKDVGRPVRFVPPAVAKDVSATSILDHRRFGATDNGCDYWWIEWGGELDAVADNEAIRDELWSVVFGIWDHIKNSGRFDAETLTLEWVGSVPGKREYRRFVGDHTLTQQDVMDQTRFHDRVAFGGWSIDLHPPGGMYSDGAGSKHLFTSGVYHLPWRSLYSANVRNMLMAGRNISASHVAFGTTRVMATCAAMGEAVGVGAALAVRRGVTPREVGASHLEELQRDLLRTDAPVLGLQWTDEADLAMRATATASSELPTFGNEPGQGAGTSTVELGEVDLGVHLPVDPDLGRVELLVEAASPLVAEVELWSTAGGENHIPVRRVDGWSLPVAEGRQWLAVDIAHRPAAPEDVVVVVRRAAGLAVVVSESPAPYGVLGLLSRTPRNTPGSGHPPTNAWSARELRRRGIVLRTSRPTDAYRAEQVRGGYLRPFGGPRLWSSQRMTPGRDEWVALEWDAPVRASAVDLVFNDDVDEDIVNLHHHTTPFPVMPELVRDYALQVRADDAWTTVAEVTGNRRRLRRHDLADVPGFTALRVLVHATNGSPWAMLHGVRVHAAATVPPTTA